MQEEHGKNYWGQLFLQMLFHPIFLVVYGLAWFYLARLFWYGPAENCLPQLILCGLYFVLYLILFFVRGFTGHVQGGLFARGSFRRPYRIFAAGVLAALTLFFGFHSLQGYREGALARKLENLTNQRVLTPIHTNLFETGLDGLLEDVDQMMELPDELYLGDDLNLLFDSDGTLRSLYTYLYGKGKDGQTQSFQLAYDRDISDQLTIYLLGISTDEYPESRRLDPLLETLDHLDLAQAIRPSLELGYDACELWYSGLEEWSDPEQTLFYLNQEGEARSAQPDPQDPVVNYGVSLCLPDLEPGDEVEGSDIPYQPEVYIYVEDVGNIESSNARGREILDEENRISGDTLFASE